MKTLAPLAVACLLAGTHAHAGQTIASASVPLTITDWDTAGSSNPLSGQPLLLPKYSGPGTLDSVTFSLRGTMVSTFYATDVTDNEPLTNHLMGSLIFALPSIGTRTLNFDQTDSRNGSFGPVDLMVVVTDSVGVVGSLADFVGNGVFAVDVAAFGTSEINGSGNYDAGIDTTASARLELIYDWTTNRQQVPEPAALALLGLALAALALSRRSQRA